MLIRILLFWIQSLLELSSIFKKFLLFNKKQNILTMLFIKMLKDVKFYDKHCELFIINGIMFCFQQRKLHLRIFRMKDLIIFLPFSFYSVNFLLSNISWKEYTKYLIWFTFTFYNRYFIIFVSWENLLTTAIIMIQNKKKQKTFRFKYLSTEFFFKFTHLM